MPKSGHVSLEEYVHHIRTLRICDSSGKIPHRLACISSPKVPSLTPSRHAACDAARSSLIPSQSVRFRMRRLAHMMLLNFFCLSEHLLVTLIPLQL